jgi:hypothetical protein
LHHEFEFASLGSVRERADIGADRHGDSGCELLAELFGVKGQHGALTFGGGRRLGMGGKVFGDGEGWYGVDLLLAHDAHGFRAELVGMVDGSDTGLGCVEGSGLSGGVDSDAGAQASGLMNGGFKLGLGVLVRRGELTIDEAVGAGLVDLDEVCALFVLGSYGGDKFVGSVGVGGVGGDVFGGIEVDCVLMSAEDIDGIAADAQAGTGNESGVDGIANGRISGTARIVRSGTDSMTVWRSSAPGWRKRWMWASISPGIKVESPRSIRLAPAGWETDEPASTMRLPRTSTSPGVTSAPCSTSSRWAAWRMVVSLAGAEV